MSVPEYLICLNCETPTYSLDYENEKLVSVLCTTCGNDDPAEFMSETELEEQRD
jgi:translation initiation factor 2 beta subunit (eIF-2beta)/eIF-5